MASRRMFSIRLINSARFLKMPISCQALYFHLGLHADDDGIVEAYNVIKTVGCTEDDLKVLVGKGFVQVLNEDLVSYITDWRENNKIRADRKIDSIYKDLLISLNPTIDLLEPQPRADRKGPTEESGTSHGQPMDGQWTDNGRHRLGKDRLVKDRIGEDRVETQAQEKALHCNEGVTECNTEKRREREEKRERREDKRIDYQQIADMYNETCVSFPRLVKLSDTRKKAIKARLRNYTVDDFKRLFEMAEQSDFLKGKNKRNWSATFDWLINDANMAKVLEGNYANSYPNQRKIVNTAPMVKVEEEENYETDEEWLERMKREAEEEENAKV